MGENHPDRAGQDMPSAGQEERSAEPGKNGARGLPLGRLGLGAASARPALQPGTDEALPSSVGLETLRYGINPPEEVR